MSTLFTKIMQGEIPCYKVYEDEHVFAFLTIEPHNPGHTLIVPKIEVDYFVDVPEPYYSAVFVAAKKLAPAIQEVSGASRIGLSVMGFEVPHFHLHLIPMLEIGDMAPSKAKPASKEELEAVHKQLRAVLEKRQIE